MSLNNTPSSDRIHIGFFGKRNSGKSSIVNAVTGQSLSVVSPVKGTTTDPVYKSMELLPIGPVMIIDTPGLDDEGELGELRVGKSRQVLGKTDIAVLVIDGSEGRSAQDDELAFQLEELNIPYIVAYNKSDLTNRREKSGDNEIWVSAATKEGIHELKELIAAQTPRDSFKYPIIVDLVKPYDTVILVIPIDSAAPKGRLILPQQQTVRELLEAGAISVCVREHELAGTIAKLGNPALVVTDSQAFAQVSRETPQGVPLTSFSILFARHKGDLSQLVEGVRALDTLREGASILISEGCTHHRQCDDIGTFKLPKWIKSYTGKDMNFSFTSGTEFPQVLSD